MPEGSLFSDQEVGSVQVLCAQKKASKTSRWTTDCVLQFLCKQDRDVVAKIAKSTVDKSDDIYMWTQLFYKHHWKKEKFYADGYALPEIKYIMMLASQSCEEAISTFYHETWHHYQDPRLGWPHDSEDDAYYHEELWNIERGLPGNPALHTRDANGNLVPDKAAIRRYVDESYGRTNDRPIAKKIDQHGQSWTELENNATGASYWRPSEEGDRIFGPEHYTNKQNIPKSTWKCLSGQK